MKFAYILGMAEPGRVLQVLLVEDEEADRHLFSLAIQYARAKLSLHTVSNGREAIEYLEGKKGFGDRKQFPIPDVIVLDLRMPLMDGFEFLKWRSASAFSGIAVIVFEDSGIQRDLQKALRLGATLALTKPVVLEQLEFIVREIGSFEIGSGG